MEMQKQNYINLGLVGMGHVADYQLEALKRLANFRLVAACDKDSAKRTKVPQDISFYQEPDELMASPNVDAVLVSVPIQEHFRVAKAALEAGKHVLLEKPATSNIGEFDDLVSLARDNNKLLVIAFHAAFARDLLWFLEHYGTRLREQVGTITGFRCGFYDPYLADGQLLPQANSLKGSWTDSGINALSVVAQLVEVQSLEIEEVRLTRLPVYGNIELQGTAHLTFSATDSDRAGRGAIDTNWALGINHKVTRLYFAHTLSEIILHHSDQKVFLVDRYGRNKLLADCSADGVRLVNHYLGVFEDFRSRLATSRDNITLARKLHQILFSVSASATV